MHLIALFVPIIAFFFESYPRFLNRKFGVDVWTHLLYLKEFHKQKGIPKKINDGFLVSGVYDYPPAFIIILSKLPFKLVEKYEFLFSPIFDVIHILLIYWLVFQMTGSIQIAIITQLFYTLTPLIVIENSSATPRSLGYTLFTLVFMLLFAFLRIGNFWYLIAALFCGALIFLSHRFTAQGFLFFAILFSLYDKTPIYLIVFFGSFIFALIFSKGFYLTVLKGHIGNLKFWYKNIAYRFAHQVKGNYQNYKTKDYIFRVYNQFLKFPPFVLTITNPWTLPVFYMLIYQYPEDILYQHLLWWSIFAYILSLVTIWVPQFRFLGEGQRYLELAAFPTSFLAALVLNKALLTDLSVYFVFIYSILAIGALLTIIVIQRKAIINEKLRTLTPQMQKMFNYLKALKKKPKLLCIPHQITTSTIYHTGCPVFVNADYTNIQKIADVYPYLKLPVSDIMKKYNLNLILLNEDYIHRKEMLKKSKFTVVKEVKPFVLLKLK